VDALCSLDRHVGKSDDQIEVLHGRARIEVVNKLRVDISIYCRIRIIRY
jgi:hypothetical protein